MNADRKPVVKKAINSVFLALLLASACASAWAQSDLASHALVPESSAFDVVSVKVTKLGLDSEIRIENLDNRFVATNVSLKMLLTSGYGLRNGLIYGLPAWAESDRFDVIAKVTTGKVPSLTPAERQSRIRAILADRFGLTCHYERKSESVYFLEVAKNGPKLKRSATNEGQKASDEALAPSPMSTTSGRQGEITAAAESMSSLAQNLSEQLKRNVVDRTGLTALYDFSLSWTPDEELEGLESKDDGKMHFPRIFTALKEQLGLTLKPGKSAVEVLVIDRVGLPTAN